MSLLDGQGLPCSYQMPSKELDPTGVTLLLDFSNAKLPAACFPQQDFQSLVFMFCLPVWRLLYTMLVPDASLYQCDVPFL